MGDSTEDASHSSVPLGPRVESVLNILRIIGKSQLIEAGALEQGSCWDDNMVPYTRTQLPKNKNGNVNYEARFLEEQRKLYDRASFPRSIIRDIIEHAQKNSRPPHIATLHISDIFEIGKLLGEGAYGHVHSVTLPDNDNRLRTKGSNIFALKRIRKPAPTEGGAVRATTPRAFQKELDILSRCTGDNVHRHFIKFCASFTDEDYFGFIVTPVATSSLQQVLSNYINTNNIGDDKDVRAILHSAFGCLLDAVCYLHEDLNIRHRDLKPKNILIHKGRVVICDMGSAYDYEPADRKESTEDRRPPGTYRYKAPEVLRSARSDKPGKHNNKTDIFSLGCIFLEMHTVLNEETLQTMAKAITNDDNTEFDERLDGKDWAYADEHEGVIKWLKGLDSQEESPTRLVKDMLASCREKRESAANLLEELRSTYHKYIGPCCRRGRDKGQAPAISPLAQDRLSHSLELEHEMDYSTPRPFKSCKIERRELNHRTLEYGDYELSREYREGGEVEVRINDVKCANWARTHLIIISPTRSPRSVEEQWLPPYYVHWMRVGRWVDLEWSDCDQPMSKRRDSLNDYKKGHYTGPSRYNLRMSIDFQSEKDANSFCTLLFTDPIDGNNVFDKAIAGRRQLVVQEFNWQSKYEQGEDQGRGMQVVCLRRMNEHMQPSRLEPWFIPDTVDFALPPGGDQTFNKFVLQPLWVPQYRSDGFFWRASLPEKGNFESVELVRSRKKIEINFDVRQNGPPDTAKRIVTQGALHEPDLKSPCNNNDVQELLSILTGWTSISIFSATGFRQRGLISHPIKDPADVLCFQKDGKTRIAVRTFKATDRDAKTLDWRTATLVDGEDGVHVNTATKKLDMRLASMQKGKTLALSSVSAVGGRGSIETGRWVFTVNSVKAAREIHSKLVPVRDSLVSGDLSLSLIFFERR